MDAGVVSGTLHGAPAAGFLRSFVALVGAGKVPSTLRVTAARAISFVIAPRRCDGIAVVALPWI